LQFIRPCGTLSVAKVETRRWGMYNENSETTCNKAEIQSKKDWCNTAPYRTEDGQASGIALFVSVDCGTNKLLPMEQQHPAYQYVGVSTGPKDKAKFVRR
jgi:hypothetical protein